MKNITIPESEYLRLVQTVQELKAEIQSLKARFSTPEKKPNAPSDPLSSPFERLRGVITLPDGFDHKDFMGDELLASYFSK